MTFAVYAGQWLAVIGFLPAIYLEAGVSGAATGLLTALAAAVNMAGNLAVGPAAAWRRAADAAAGHRLCHDGAGGGGGLCGRSMASALPPALRYAAILVFSLVGGLIPATLFSLAVRLAPSEQTLSSTVGWMQQWSAFGQFAGPPLVAWVASRSGGWQWTWVATGACSLLGLLLAARIAALLRLRSGAPLSDNR